MTTTTSARFSRSYHSNPHMLTSVILLEKGDSHCHSTMSFREKVVVVKTSYKMLELLSFCNKERV